MRHTLDRTLATMFVAYRKPIDDTTATLYERALADVPPALLDAAVARAIRTRRFLPTVAELREDAERCRQDLSAHLPFVACAECRERRPGWIVVVDPDEVRREARCGCWQRHQAVLRGAGYTREPFSRPALPAADPESAEMCVSADSPLENRPDSWR